MVHYVVPNSALLKRDRNDFEDYFALGKHQKWIHYHERIDFTPKQNSVVLIDEADVLIFKDPKKFMAFV